jgi:hypothetical protein
MENVDVTGVGVKTEDASPARDPVCKDLLTELLQEGILRPDYEKELHQLNDAGKSSKPFEALCQDYIDLVLDFYSEDIDVTDGDIQREALTKDFGNLHLEYGETPTMRRPSPCHQPSNHCLSSLKQAKKFVNNQLSSH